VTLNPYYEVADLWEREKYLSGYERTRFQSAIQFIPQEATSLIDVGCGNGAFLSILEEQRPHTVLKGVEPSGAAIGQKLCHCEILQSDAGRLPFPDTSFDVVSSMEVLEHIPQRAMPGVLSELMRLSRRYILLGLPYCERRARIVCPECNCGFDPHLHLRSYDDEKVASLFPDFVERRREILYGKEFVVPFIAFRVLKVEASATRYPNVICPQCGWRLSQRKPDAAATSKTGGESLLRRIWNAQPHLRVARHLHVLFERA